jgi:RNA polymerase-binding transcription factor DksA
MSVDVDRFRTELLQERARVQAAIANLRNSHAGGLHDELEELPAGSNDTLEENSEQVLAEVNAALKRIEEGSYGTCAVCGKEIAPERLEARPWASLCIDDARKAERR